MASYRKEWIDEALKKAVAEGGVKRVYVGSAAGKGRRGVISTNVSAPWLELGISGTSTCQIRTGQTYHDVEINSGDALFVCPGAWVSCQPHSTPYRVLIVRLYPAFTHAVLVEPAGNDHEPDRVTRSVPFAKYAEEAEGTGSTPSDAHFSRYDYVAAWNSPSPAGRECDLLMQLLYLNSGRGCSDPLLANLVRILFQRGHELLQDSSRHKWSTTWLHYQSAVLHIREHCGEPINRDTVAERIGIHPKYLGRLFVEHGNETFTQFLTHTRLERSLVLLRDPSLNVSEVANACGFSTAHHFIRCFKRAFGVTPGRYRVSDSPHGTGSP